MEFKQVLNDYLVQLKCSAKELSKSSRISATTISRYRSGERIPEINTENFESLMNGILTIAQNKQLVEITKQSIIDSFTQCMKSDTIDLIRLRTNFNSLLSVLSINISVLAKALNYDSSYISRFKNGQRQPSDPDKFVKDVAHFIVQHYNHENDKSTIAELLNCSPSCLNNSKEYSDVLIHWLLNHNSIQSASDATAKDISGFLHKLDDFDLNEYIRAIHFDDLKVPSVPFQLPTSRTYHGLKEMRIGELDFLKSTVLSKSMEPVLFYSDMPIEDLAKDVDFSKKYMFGLAMVLKKGLHLNVIHNINRPFHELMLGLENWIPMYMTGQISPYYLKGVQNTVFCHLQNVSGSAALAGECISGHHNMGKYYLTKNKEELTFYKEKAKFILKKASPLMDIYRGDTSNALGAFWLADMNVAGKRRAILSTLPLYTISDQTLSDLLDHNLVNQSDRLQIQNYATKQRKIAETILTHSRFETEIPYLTEEEFRKYPISLDLSGMFYEKDIQYTYEDYKSHMLQTKQYADAHTNYVIRQSAKYAFQNIQILIHEGKWVMISKNKCPAIHFIIHHQKLREAIENIALPIIES